MYTGCLKIREFPIQSVVGRDPVELEKYFEKKIRTLILFNIPGELSFTALTIKPIKKLVKTTKL
jgi:hypothetical protein